MEEVKDLGQLQADCISSIAGWDTKKEVKFYSVVGYEAKPNQSIVLRNSVLMFFSVALALKDDRSIFTNYKSSISIFSLL